MAENFVNIRIFFSKTDNAKYISHLDLYRTMGRAIKRSGLPVWITEGFNPHIYMTFALPLALGIEGLEESADLRLTQNLDFAEVTERLNSVMPQGLNVIRVAPPVRKANDIQKALYEIAADASDLECLDRYFSQSEIKIRKKTKKNTLEIDIKPLLEWRTPVLTLPAGNTLSINPLNALSGFNVGIKRISVLCDDGQVFE